MAKNVVKAGIPVIGFDPRDEHLIRLAGHLPAPRVAILLLALCAAGQQ